MEEEDVAARCGPPGRARSFYQSSALHLIWCCFIGIDAIDRLLASVPRTKPVHSVVPILVPLIASLSEAILAIVGILQACSALLFSHHHARFAALWRLFHSVLMLYIVAAYVAVGITDIRKTSHCAAIFSALGTAALRTSTLFGPLEFSARADWPSRTGCILPTLSCLIAFSGGLCLFSTSISIMLQFGGGILATPGIAGRIPLLPFIAGCTMAFWGAAGVIVTYSQDPSMARVHIAAAIPVLIINIGGLVIAQPVVALAVGSSRLDAGFAGVGPAAVAVLLTGTVGLPVYFLARQADQPPHPPKNKSHQDDTIEITLNYYS